MLLIDAALSNKRVPYCMRFSSAGEEREANEAESGKILNCIEITNL